MIELIWDNKKEMLKEINSEDFLKTDKCFKYNKEESKNFDTTENLYIEGDNLEALKLLQKNYQGKIKMIYIDPPYNTERKFIYNDTFRNKRKKECRHSGWINMMYPRLKLARGLLRDNGVIFISIDDNEVDNLKKVCNEIFGEECFITSIIWQKKTGSSDSKSIATITEEILVYVKNNKNISNIFTKNKESYDLKRYKYIDKYVEVRGPYYIDNLDRGGLQYSDSLNYPIECPDGSISYPNGRKDYKNDGWIWKWSKEKIEWALENDFLEFRKSDKKESGWAVCYKNYLLVDNKCEPIERSAPHKNLITNILNADATAEIKNMFNLNIFKYSKPASLIKLLIKLVKTQNNDIILDFFSGSATTAHAVMKLNAEDRGKRKFIMVQLPEECSEKSEAFKLGYDNICEIGKERIRRAGEKVKEENKDKEGIENLDIGFKVIKIIGRTI